MNKKKEDNTLVDTSKRKKKIKKLDGMLESMNSRSDPVSTHRIATQYFQTFKTQRNIKENNKRSDITAVCTAVFVDNEDSVVHNNNQRVDLLHTVSEDKVYNAIRTEIRQRGTRTARIGITKLREKTGLSDKTIRVAIHALEKKKSVNIEEKSLGIYGRIFSVLEPDEILRVRQNELIEIDETTKRILPR